MRARARIGDTLPLCEGGIYGVYGVKLESRNFRTQRGIGTKRAGSPERDR